MFDKLSVFKKEKESSFWEVEKLDELLLDDIEEGSRIRVYIT